MNAFFIKKFTDIYHYTNYLKLMNATKEEIPKIYFIFSTFSKEDVKKLTRHINKLKLTNTDISIISVYELFEDCRGTWKIDSLLSLKNIETTIHQYKNEIQRVEHLSTNDLLPDDNSTYKSSELLNNSEICFKYFIKNKRVLQEIFNGDELIEQIISLNEKQITLKYTKNAISYISIKSDEVMTNYYVNQHNEILMSVKVAHNKVTINDYIHNEVIDGFDDFQAYFIKRVLELYQISFFFLRNSDLKRLRKTESIIYIGC